MSSDVPKLTPGQITAYTVLQRVRMAWTALITILALFVIGLLAFLYSVFFVHSAATPKLILGGIDGLLVWPLKAVVTYLFPPHTEG